MTNLHSRIVGQVGRIRVLAGRADPDHGMSGRSSRTTNHEFPYPQKINSDLDFLLFASNMFLFGFPFCKNKHQDGKFFAIYLHDKKWQFPGNKFLRHFRNYNMSCIRIFNYFPLCSSHIASKKSNMGIHDSKLPRIGSSNPQVCISLFSSLFRKSTFDIKCMIPAAASGATFVSLDCFYCLVNIPVL